MPPCSRILHLPFEEWCDTDLELLLALDEYDAGMCSCGMARSVCRDPANHWQIAADVCGPTAALEQFERDHPREDRPDGLMLGVRLLAPGEKSTDPLKALMDAEMAAVKARHSPQTQTGGAS